MTVTDRSASAAPCPLCGAVFWDGEPCADHYYALQSREFEDPGFGAVHHLSVPCYQLQHRGYSGIGWLEVRSLLVKFVYMGWTPAMARRQARVTADSGHRTWSFTHGPTLPEVDSMRWTVTLADVRLDDAEHYCTDVRRWAQGLLQDTAELVRRLQAAE